MLDENVSWFGWTCAFLGLVIGVLIGSAIGVIESDANLRHLRAEAVSRGYAEWKVDPKTGETTWGWKDKP